MASLRKSVHAALKSVFQSPSERRKTRAEKHESRMAGPGVWLKISLAHRVTLPDDAEDELATLLWETVTEGSGRVRGGRIGGEKAHCTVLLRLDGPDELAAVQEVAQRTEPMEVRGTSLYLERNGRLSNEFGEEIYSLGMGLDVPLLETFRTEVVRSIARRTGQDEKAVRTKHDPYFGKRESAGHCSISYHPASSVAAVRALADRLRADLPRHVACTVRGLQLVQSDGVLDIPLQGILPLERRALSFKVIEDFYSARLASGAISSEMSTADAVAATVVPETEHLQDSFAALVRQDDPDAVGTVTHFISHAWRYAFADLMECIRAHHARLPPAEQASARFWVDILCANQHSLFSPEEIPNLWACLDVARTTVLVVSPWKEPVTVSRAWCLYEILGTMRNERPLQVEMPAREQRSFTEALLNDFAAVRSAITAIDSERAQATSPKDLAQIRGLIQDQVGFQSLNTLVKEELRQWLVRACLANLQDLMAAPANASAPLGFELSVSGMPAADRDAALTLVRHVALFLGDVGRTADAETLYEFAMRRLGELRNPGGVVVGPHTLSVLSDLCFCMNKTGRAAESEALLREAIAVLAAARASGDAAVAQEAADALDGHLAVAARGLETAEQQLEAAELLMSNNLAMALGAQGDERAAEAVAVYRDVVRRREVLYGTSDNIHVLASKNNMAWLLLASQPGAEEEAEQLFREVHAFRAHSMGAASPGALNAEQNLARALLKRGQAAEAAERMARIVKAKLENMGAANRSTLSAMLVLAEAQKAAGDKDGAKGTAAELRAHAKNLGKETAKRFEKSLGKLKL